MLIATHRVDTAALAHVLEHSAVVPSPLCIRHDEKLAHGIARELFAPALAQRIHTDMRTALDAHYHPPLGEDRALAQGALSSTIHRALSIAATKHAERFSTELALDRPVCASPAALASRVSLPQLRAGISVLEHELNCAEQAHLALPEPVAGYSQDSHFRRERRRATNPFTCAQYELGLYPEHFPMPWTANLLVLPVSAQTKAIIEYRLAKFGDGDAVARFKRARELATNPQTQALSEYELALRGDGDVIARFKHARELATDPDLQAAAEYQLAQQGDGDVIVRLKRACELTVNPQTQALAEYALAQHGDGDVIARLKRVRELTLDPEVQALTEYALAQQGDGDIIARFKHARELATNPEMQALAEYALAKRGDGDVVARLKHVCELATDPDLQAAAEHQLAQQGDGDVIARLKRACELATNPQTRAVAEYELAQHGDGDVIARLKRARELATDPQLQGAVQAMLDRHAQDISGDPELEQVNKRQRTS